MSTPPRRSTPFSTGARGPNDPNSNDAPRHSYRNVAEADNVVARTLRNENDLLRYQLNDIIAREKNQRIELQRLRAHRDVEVASLVQAATQQLKGEVEQMKVLLQSTSAQLLQALTEKEKAINDSQGAVRSMEEVKQHAEMQETTMVDRLRAFEDVFAQTSGTVTQLADSVEGFQRHVLPTFKPAGTDLSKLTKKLSTEPGPTQIMVSELARLEAGVTLLRVIVDAKNDTLVLIRGKLKQENEELRAELQVARERESKHPSISDRQLPNASRLTNDDLAYEKNMLRQELHSLQSLFNAEVKQLKAKLKMYEQEEAVGQSRFSEVQHECQMLQNKINTLEASRAMLESSLKDETSARSQLVSQLFNMRKENEKIRTELETLKLNQKFLVRQPRSGRIPVEKMDLMNTVNQLLLEMNKLKGDKVALEEEIKTQRRCQVRDRVKRTVTARDVAMAASNKVGDGELAGKLANTRLHQLAQGNSRLSTPVPPSQLALTEGSPNQSMAMINLHGDRLGNNAVQSSQCCVDTPTRDDFNKRRYGQSPRATMNGMNGMGGLGAMNGGMNGSVGGGMGGNVNGGLVQLIGERFSSPS